MKKLILNIKIVFIVGLASVGNVYCVDEALIHQQGYFKYDTVYIANGDWYLTNTTSSLNEIPINREPASVEEFVIEWDEPVRITEHVISDYTPKAYISDGNIYLVWFYNGEVNFIMSSDNGETWINETIISDHYQDDYRHCIIAEGNHVLIAWIVNSYGTYLRESTDGGAYWNDIEFFEWFVYSPALCKFRPDSVFMFYSEDSNYWVTNTNDWGYHWSDSIQLGICIPSATAPGYATSNNSINVTGQSTAMTDIPEIYYHGSPDGGITWNTDIPISDIDNYCSQWSALGADDSGNIYISWFDFMYSGGFYGDIFLRKSLDDGNTWGDIQVISNSHAAMSSSIAANENGAFIVWEDHRHNNYDSELYIRSSYDLGETWQPEQRITNAQNDSNMPYLLIDNYTLHLFWEDHRDNNSEIYYKKGHIIQTGIRDYSNSPIKFKINAYPNPFNATTTIQYTLPKTSDVAIDIYDILGRKVETLLNIKQQAGNYQVSWNAADKTSGMYFYKLQAGDFIETKKMLLLK